MTTSAEKARLTRKAKLIAEITYLMKIRDYYEVHPNEIRVQRECAGYSWAEAAAMINCTEREWFAWEAGSKPMPVRLWKEWQGKSILFEIPIE